MLTTKKGALVDGHEQADVVEYRAKFLHQMVSLGFVNSGNAPTEEARLALPDDFECPSKAVLNKNSCDFS